MADLSEAPSPLELSAQKSMLCPSVGSLTGNLGLLILRSEASLSIIEKPDITHVYPAPGSLDGAVAVQKQSMMPLGASSEVHNARQFVPFRTILDMHLLPVRKLLQLRRVCKLWNLMLVGPDSVGAGEVMEDEEYWFVMSKPFFYWHFTVLSSSSGSFSKETSWIRFPLPLPRRNHAELSSLIGRQYCEFLQRHSYSGRYRPRLCSAGGLMCACVEKQGSDHGKDSDIIVFNCLTGSVRVLPPPLDRQQLLGNSTCCNIYMAIDDRDPGRFYILLTHSEVRMSTLEFYFEIFDSECGFWKVGCNPYSPTTEPSQLNVTDGDFFFFLYSSPASEVLAYHAAYNTWSIVHVPNRESEPKSACSYCSDRAPTFLKHKGRVFQGLHRNCEFMCCCGFVVWELQPTSLKAAIWIEVSETKDLYWGQRDGVLRAEGSLFYMVYEMIDAGQRRRKREALFMPPLVYDIAQNLWFEIPWMHASWERGCILVLRPRLSMCVPYLDEKDSH